MAVERVMSCVRYISLYLCIVNIVPDRLYSSSSTTALETLTSTGSYWNHFAS